MTSRVDTARHDVELQPYSLTADWLGLGLLKMLLVSNHHVVT